MRGAKHKQDVEAQVAAADARVDEVPLEGAPAPESDAALVGAGGEVKAPDGPAELRGEPGLELPEMPRPEPRSREVDVRRVVEELCSPLELPYMPAGRRFRNMLLPARHALIECVDELRSVMFPGYFGFREFRDDTLKYHAGATVDRVLYQLQEEIRRALLYIEGRVFEKEYAKPDQTEAITDAFLRRLPDVRWKLALDAQACYEWDPAAFIPEAPIFCYPNMNAMIHYRLAHELHKLGVPFIPRIITEHAHTLTGIDINPGAEIGESFFVDHGTGVVIGQTCIIGDRVRLYQGVTLGARSFPIDPATQRPLKGIPRHPIVEDDVVIYAEATILGRVTIGRGSIIGANVLLTRSVPAGSKVFAPPSRPVAAPPEPGAGPEETTGGG